MFKDIIATPDKPEERKKCSMDNIDSKTPDYKALFMW